MRVAVFFVCLFLLLPGGYTYIHTGTAAQPVVKVQQQKFTREANSDKAQEYLITDEVEDEDTHDLSARKYKLLARCYLTDSCHLQDLYSCSKASQPSCSPLSYKYITQRVLRI